MSESVLQSVLSAMSAALIGLDLQGVGSRVHVLKVVTERPKDELARPFLAISTTGGEGMDDFGGWSSTNERDLIVYPVVVYDVEDSGTNFAVPANDPQWLRRQRVRRLFHQRRLDGVAENLICLVSPEPIVFPPVFTNKQLRVGGLRINVLCRERRDYHYSY